MGAVINKKIKQFYYDEISNLPNSNDNIFNNYTVYSLTIHAIPGTKFSIDGTTTFSIGPIGSYILDCSEVPLTNLYLIEPIKHDEQLIYPIIIDIEYKEVNISE